MGKGLSIKETGFFQMVENFEDFDPQQKLNHFRIMWDRVARYQKHMYYSLKPERFGMLLEQYSQEFTTRTGFDPGAFQGDKQAYKGLQEYAGGVAGGGKGEINVHDLYRSRAQQGGICRRNYL